MVEDCTFVAVLFFYPIFSCFFCVRHSPTRRSPPGVFAPLCYAGVPKLARTRRRTLCVKGARRPVFGSRCSLIARPPRAALSRTSLRSRGPLAASCPRQSRGMAEPRLVRPKYGARALPYGALRRSGPDHGARKYRGLRLPAPAGPSPPARVGPLCTPSPSGVPATFFPPSPLFNPLAFVVL